MYLSPSTWAGLSFAIYSLLPFAAAFYPYEPEYGSNDDNTRHDRRSQSPTIANSKRDGSFTLPLRRVRVRRDNTYNIVQSSNPKQDKSVAIDQDGNDLSYMVAVTLGDSKEQYHLLLDSAATNTWVMAEGCKSAACGSHNLFGSSDSSSLKTQSTTFSITYGTGTVSGTDASDTLHIGSLSADITFGLASNVSDDFKSYPMDGILGIGRGDTQDAIDATLFMSVLKSSNSISSKLYGAHLSRAKDGSNDGELNFGAPNKDRYDGDLNFVKTKGSNAGFWEIGVDDLGVDSTSLNLKGRSAILDTGTSYILMPPADAAALHKLIPGSKNSSTETYTVPCDTKQVIWLQFNGQKYNISTADFVGGTVSDGNCKSNVIGRQTFAENEWLVGDVFLKNVYAVFDYDNGQVGFGVKGVGTQATTTSSRTPTGTASSGSKTTTSGAGSPTLAAGESNASPLGVTATATTASHSGSTVGKGLATVLELIAPLAVIGVLL